MGGIEATAFHRLSDEAWDGLASEARALVAFLADREPRAYSRYGRWWADLPGAEVRVLGRGATELGRSGSRAKAVAAYATSFL